MMNLTMKTVTFGTIIQDTRDEKIWEIIGKDSKAKTIMMETTNMDGTTSTRHFSLSTVNKNFEEMGMRMVVDPEQEEPAEVVETVQEVTAPAEKKERKKRTKKELTADVSGLLEFINNEWEKVGKVGKGGKGFCPLCAEGGRQVIKLMWTTKKVSMFVRVESVTQYAEKWQKINYGMPFQCMFFSNTETTQDNIRKLFADVLDADSVRIKKERKTKKAD